MLGAREADRLHDAIEHLAVVDLDDVVAALDAEALHGIGREHADLGVSRDALRSDGIGIELRELAEAARSRLLIAPDGTCRVTAVGLGELVVVLGDETGERRRQVIAQ